MAELEKGNEQLHKLHLYVFSSDFEWDEEHAIAFIAESKNQAIDFYKSIHPGFVDYTISVNELTVGLCIKPEGYDDTDLSVWNIKEER